MDIAFPLLGGLGLFLYGMEVLSRGIQRIAGNRLKGLLRTLTANRFVGVLSGTLSTAIVQSSSVTTVMVVGFVNAGLMALPQAISVILGAHIGTTITAQIIAFRIQNFALPMIAAGAFIHLFGRTDRAKDSGEVLFGFGILFFGLQLMGTAFDPLRDNAIFHKIFESFAAKPWLGFLAGMGVTILVQSSSITTGITIALALSSLITFEQAVPLILGENVGTTVTANLAALSGSHAAKQAARAHFIINGIGAILALILLNPFLRLVLFISPAQDAARQIANSHTLFNILNTILFFPLVALIATLSNMLIFGKKKMEELYYLEEASLQDPGTALDQVKTALKEMHGFAAEFLKHASEMIVKKQEKYSNFMTALSEKIDRYQSRISEFLEAIVEKKLSKEQSVLVPGFVRILHEIERIRDYDEKMKRVGIRLISEGRSFSSAEKRELKDYFADISDLMKKTREMIDSGNKKLGEEILGIYESLNAKKEELRNRSRKRYTSHRTEIAIANYYYDVISSLEEIAKKCRNIAVAMLE
ncbi:Na/Pi cotransporter family protein [Candidatus Peregrinibacteria bacterium]|nr:Na/Pi cotransporter family protein [Candidatus Peregrinibacteria bacterium]